MQVLKKIQRAIVSNYNEFRLFNPACREKNISFNFNELKDNFKKIPINLQQIQFNNKKHTRNIIKRNKTY